MPPSGETSEDDTAEGPPSGGDIGILLEDVSGDRANEEDLLNATKAIVGILESGQLDEAAVVATVAAIISEGVSESQATVLAASQTVLSVVTDDQASQIFEAIDEGALSDDAAEAIVDAVQEAPLDVREAFEEVVALFEGAFDSYKMINQNITVGQRRTVVAVSALTTAIAAVGPTMGGAGGPQGPSSPSGGGRDLGPNPDGAARREEDEEEPQGEIAGDGVEWIRRISIFTYIAGVRVLNKRNFSKKFVYGIMNLGFTLAGSLVVYLTLSGPIQTIAGLSTVAAFVAAMWLHMKEPE